MISLIKKLHFILPEHFYSISSNIYFLQDSLELIQQSVFNKLLILHYK